MSSTLGSSSGYQELYKVFAQINGTISGDENSNKFRNLAKKVFDDVETAGVYVENAKKCASNALKYAISAQNAARNVSDLCQYNDDGFFSCEEDELPCQTVLLRPAKMVVCDGSIAASVAAMVAKLASEVSLDAMFDARDSAFLSNIIAEKSALQAEREMESESDEGFVMVSADWCNYVSDEDNEWMIN